MTFAKLIKFCDKNGYEIERNPGSPYFHSKYDYEWRRKDDEDLNWFDGGGTLKEVFSDILKDIEERKREHEIENVESGVPT
jgi:hypothetical protein